jgi:hypothetical protein
VGLGFSERGELVSDGKDVLPMLKKRLFGCDFDDGFEFALCRQERVSAKRRRRRGEVVVSNRGKSYPVGESIGLPKGWLNESERRFAFVRRGFHRANGEWISH